MPWWRNGLRQCHHRCCVEQIDRRRRRENEDGLVIVRKCHDDRARVITFGGKEGGGIAAQRHKRVSDPIKRPSNLECLCEIFSRREISPMPH